MRRQYSLHRRAAQFLVQKGLDRYTVFAFTEISQDELPMKEEELHHTRIANCAL